MNMTSASIKDAPVTPTAPAKLPRSRPLAFMVKKDGEEFSELLKTVRSKVDPEVTGNAISRLRKSKNGDLLIVINGGNESAEVV